MIKQLIESVKDKLFPNPRRTIDMSDKGCSYRGCNSPCSHLILQTTTTAVQLGECPNIFGACDKHLSEIEEMFRCSLGSIHKAFKVKDGLAMYYPRFWEL